MPGKFCSSTRELIPGTLPGICIVPDAAARKIRDNLDDRFGQIAGIRRRPELVVYHTDFRSFRSQLQDSLHEVFPELTIQPRRPDNHILTSRRRHRNLPFQLGLPINAERIGNIRFPPRLQSGAA